MTSASPAPRSSASPAAAQRSLPAAAAVAATVKAIRNGGPLLLAFVVYEFACQLALLIPALKPIRVVLRTAAFSGSLAMLLMLPGKPLTRHPARAYVTVGLAMLGISALSPLGAGPLGAFAHLCFHLCIVGPLFWVARVKVTSQSFHWLVTLLWLVYTVSAGFGILQVYFPGHFQPPIEDLIKARGAIYAEAMKITLANGEVIYRPMGLSDAPGGAAVAGFYAALLGLGVLQVRSRFRGARLLAVGSIVIGLMAMYLSHVRSLLVATGISAIGLLLIFAVGQRVSRLLIVSSLLVVLAVVGYKYAADVGGDMMIARVATLTEGEPTDVYYANRGHFLERTFTEMLPQYPLGAGLARWGMMNVYFGVPGSAIYVEIQWTGWLLDGGVVLCLAYAAAVVSAILAAARVALSKKAGELGLWAAVVAGYGLGVFAITFNATPFSGTSGVEFWMLLAALYQAAYGPGGVLASAEPVRIAPATAP